MPSKMNQNIITQTSAFIKIQGDPSSHKGSPGVKNVTVHTGEWGNTDLSDKIN